MAASKGSTARISPPVSASAPSAAAPKPANSTLDSGRFMALAMSWVSSVPAAPTTMPAIIIAGISSTKPSKPTASPVSALYSEITTGMSAPPMGTVSRMPASAARAKNSARLPGVAQ